MTVFPDCLTCKHLDRTQPRGTFKCAAFPDGIPDPILYAEADHTQPFPGDHGVRYERDETIAPPADAPVDPLEDFDF